MLQPLNFDCQGQVICVQCVFALSTRSTECKYHLLFWDEFNNARLGRARHIYQLTYQAKEFELVEFFASDLEFVKERVKKCICNRKGKGDLGRKDNIWLCHIV